MMAKVTSEAGQCPTFFMHHQEKYEKIRVDEEEIRKTISLITR